MSFYTNQEKNNWMLHETIKNIVISEERYCVDATYPVYSLRNLHLYAFNTIIYDEITSYVQDFINIVQESVLLNGIRYKLNGKHFTYTADRRFITVKLDFYLLTGGAHSSHTIITITFDTVTDTIIALSDLFDANSNYLERLSLLSEQALFEKYPDLSFAFTNPTYRKGFAPNEENFTHWALTDRSLIIFFPEYQVAPYAAGILEIEIPYLAVKDMIRYNLLTFLYHII